MPSKQLWYTRREKQIRGPFPAGQITRDILLGRILQTDELSADQISWQPVTDLPELIPEELKADLTVLENKERLRIARFREDERHGIDRRCQQREDVDDMKPRGKDRRSPESIDAIQHRLIKSDYLDNVKTRNELASQFSPKLLVLLALVVAVWVVTMFTPL